MRRKKQVQDAPASGDGRVTPVDVQQVEFRLAFRGYSERDVDAFLDRVTEDLSSYLEEIERLRSGTAPAGPTSEGADADAILGRAREEAAAIVQRAEEDAAAIRAAAATSGVGSGDARAAIAPFLNREREFLQSLGTLVQGHAEEIKGMVVALRARSESEGPKPAPTAAVPIPATPGSVTVRDERPAEPESPSTFPSSDEPSDELEPASASEIADRLGMTDATSEDRDEVGTVVIESSTEPAYSSEGAPAGERRERSLRELFWGED